MRLPRFAWILLACQLAFLALLSQVPAADAANTKISDVRNTKHNLSATPPTTTLETGTRTVVATSETQICVFCHTPHGAENIPKAPLWNRKLSGASYTTYTSSSIEADAAELAAGPGGTSKLCLSCHDGTMALGSVNVLNGKANQTITMSVSTMPAGVSTTSGFTRNLGVDLTNDHPISFTFDAGLVTRDGELRPPDGTIVGNRSAGVRPKLPLQDQQVQCSTCHDPHLRETVAANGPSKFLRLNRLQGTIAPSGTAFAADNDIFCLACHDKDQGVKAWALSAHANPAVADELFTTTAADQRQFPANLPVWRAACLSCHDTHTVQGARRLLREGTDSGSSPKGGGTSAIEETCYQCHSPSGAPNVLTSVASVPDIKTEFGLATHMPIKNTEQQTGGEVHDIGTGSGDQRGKDFYEDPSLLGKTDSKNRHVECTDCHNPHRVIKNRLFNADATTPDAGGTHNHASGHTNIASGVLRGAYGVEPTWGSATFGTNPTFTVKRGIPGASSAVDSGWVTREYQVCLKCHSNYAYTTPPKLGDSGGGTSAGTNGLNNYSNQGMEFQAPSGHKGQTPAGTTDSGAYKGEIRYACASSGSGSTCGSGSCVCYNVDFQAANHRAWHPVVDNTDRSLSKRGITGTSPWLAPWADTTTPAQTNTGSQTMYCSDCHGSETAAGTVVPNSGKPWGPHGSGRNFILKGTWTDTSGLADSGTLLCLKCHDSTVYASTQETQDKRTGFWNPGSSVSGGNGRGNLHTFHANKIQNSGGTKTFRCSWCHIAVPHGWKNRSFLVNLNDVGPEAVDATTGRPYAQGTQVRNGVKTGFNAEPYYMRAVLKIRTFGTPGSWIADNCGSVGKPGTGESGRQWMRDGNEACGAAP